MSCPLDKLAPETRTMIYEYVLSFDTPLKHATKMQPFVKKLTGSEVKSAPPHSTDSETETITEPQRVNTSILTASKLIYVEAIAVFYKRNTIHFDAELCAREDIVSPRATDLSLATHIVVRVEDLLGPGKFLELCGSNIPAIFSNLRTGSVYVSLDADPHPLVTLTAAAHCLRCSDLFDKVYYDDVGSLTASFLNPPCLKLIARSRWTTDRWRKPAEPLPAGGFDMSKVSASSLRQFSRTDPWNDYAQIAQRLFDCYMRAVKFPALENVEQDGHEFWTVVDAYLCLYQDLHP